MGRASPGVRLTSLLMVMAVLTLVGAFETRGRVSTSKRRSVAHHFPSLWRRTRAMTTTPFQQGNRLTNLLLGGESPIKHPSRSRQRRDEEANSFLFLSEDEQPSTEFEFIDSDLQDGRLDSEDFPPIRQKRNQAFFDTPQTIWNLGGPRRRLMAMNWDPDSSYLPPDEMTYSSYRDAGRRPMLSFHARKIVGEPEEREAWKRPTQKYWRRFRSLDDRSKRQYLLTSKRQPPPGFHAIRGKRESEPYGAGQEEAEEGQTAINRWIQQLTRHIRHQQS